MTILFCFNFRCPRCKPEGDTHFQDLSRLHPQAPLLPLLSPGSVPKFGVSFLNQNINLRIYLSWLSAALRAKSNFLAWTASLFCSDPSPALPCCYKGWFEITQNAPTFTSRLLCFFFPVGRKFIIFPNPPMSWVTPTGPIDFNCDVTSCRKHLFTPSLHQK